MSWLAVIDVITPAFVLVLTGLLFGRFARTDIPEFDQHCGLSGCPGVDL